MRILARLAVSSSLVAIAPAQGLTELASHVDQSTEEGSAPSRNPELSSDGRFVVFASGAPNLVPGLAVSGSHIYLADRATGTIEIVDRGPGGDAANDSSFRPHLSADARYVVFSSRASDLGGFGGPTEDVFVHDRQLVGYECLSSTSTDGRYSGRWPRMSADARFVVLVLDDTTAPPTHSSQIWRVDRTTGVRTLCSASTSGASATANCAIPDISDDGRFVAFVSPAADLVPGDTNATSDVFVKDLLTGELERVSVSTAGVEGDASSTWPRLSADGRFVSFVTFATTWFASGARGACVRDRVAQTTELVHLAADGSAGNSTCQGAAISDDGSVVVFNSRATNLVPEDGHFDYDVYLRDRARSVTRCLSLANGSYTGNASTVDECVSGDGRTFAFSATESISQVYTHDPSIGAGRSWCEGTFAACPCGNNGLRGHGCESSLGNGGALLDWSGNASTLVDTLELTATFLPATTTVLFFQGTVAAGEGVGVPFGDGLRCASGAVLRLAARVASAGSASVGPASGSAPLSVLGALPVAGATRVYQAWYRNVTPGYCTPAGFNLSNGIEMRWGY